MDSKSTLITGIRPGELIRLLGQGKWARQISGKNTFLSTIFFSFSNQ